jgi:asparagine synthase (glutamine-hydrolysing)
MCGILALIGKNFSRQTALELSRKQRHRGPDWSGIFQNEKVILCHERLSIIDPFSGGQPLISKDKRYVLTVNGEIYNHRQWRDHFMNEYEFQTESDCEVIIPLYHRYGIDMCKHLDGEFAFVLLDTEKNTVFAARDPFGVNPLYLGYDRTSWGVSSEMKALPGGFSKCIFPPGHFVQVRSDDFVLFLQKTEQLFKRWFDPQWLVNRDFIPMGKSDPATLRNLLEGAVIKRCMSDVPWGVLLSGGLDSSLVAALAVRYFKMNHNMLMGQVPSFCIGLEGSPDLIAAQKVADFLSTKHYGFTFTVQEGLDALCDVIGAIETFDVTTIRASTPMYLLSRKIKALGIKMVLSGEGADEVFAGYLYFHKCPNRIEMQKETVRKVDKLHLYDCNRANKATMAWGVEIRPPFLDKDLVNYAMGELDPSEKMITLKMEKHLLRSAFAGENLLPEEVLWRQKEQFSDGVGYGWIDALKEFTNKRVSDKDMAEAGQKFPVNTPLTKEAYYYRKIFEEEHFPCSTSAVETVPGGFSIACSTPEVLAWDKSFAANNDPSGRAVFSVHQK